MSELSRRAAVLRDWLKQCGLGGNPFEVRSAEQDPNLPSYFVDMGILDDLLRLREPCIVFAERGCGKTAQRQMVAAQCRPTNPSSPMLAVTYSNAASNLATLAGSHRAAETDPTPFITALLRHGMVALNSQVESDAQVRAALTKSDLAPRFSAYLGRYGQYPPAVSRDTGADLGTSAVELWQGFAAMVRAAGFEMCIVLIDGLDESPQTADDPDRIVALLAPLLGTLALIDSPGIAFRFFLPQEINGVLRTHGWYRPDRLQIFRLSWQSRDLQDLIGQRLTYFSQGSRVYTRLGQLCTDDFAERMDVELAECAAGQPRVALILADLLLRTHCENPDPPARIRPETWRKALNRWEQLRTDYLSVDQHPAASQIQASQPVGTTHAFSLLRVDTKHGRAWLGEQDITSEINPRDFSVLMALYDNKDAVCDQRKLAELAWPKEQIDGVSDQAVAAAIGRLRKNLGNYDPEQGYIETIKGRGYWLHPDGFQHK